MRLILTRRQAQVLDLLQREWSYPRISRELGCKPETVRVHVQAIASHLPWPELPPRRAVEKYLRDQPCTRPSI